MLSSSRAKIHEPLVTGVSPRPTNQRGARKTAKHEGYRGHGLAVMTALMQRVHWQRSAAGTTVVLVGPPTAP
jgi:anti-sigma regulatory factor (Ser/Thr protein kinase)